MVSVLEWGSLLVLLFVSSVGISHADKNGDATGNDAGTGMGFCIGSYYWYWQY